MFWHCYFLKFGLAWCHGVNFSQLNLTQCGSLVPTRLSLASPFHSCFPTTMCFAHPRRFSHSPRRRQQVNTSNTSTQEFYKNPSQPLFISSTKEYTNMVCAMHKSHATQQRLGSLFIAKCEIPSSPIIP